MRFLVGLMLLMGLVSSLLLAALFWATPYGAVAAGLRAPNFSIPLAAPLLAASPARYALLRISLLAVAGASALALGALGWRAGGNAPGRLRLEGRRAWRGLGRSWRQLSPGQRQLAAALALLALALRTWLWVALPITDDELTSFDYYVQPGLALTASNYSLPNNHVLHNLLVGGLAHLVPLPPDLLQRLPALASSAVLLPVSYLLLLRYLRFSAATLVLGLFTLLPLPLFLSVAGRGYALQLAATVAGSFGVLELLRPGGLRRLPAAVVVLGSVLGLYAVPTHAWVVLAWGAVLLVAAGTAPRRVRGRQLGCLVLAAAGVAALTALLYLPVGLVSGWAALLRNPYVQPLGWAAFRAGLSAYLVEVVSRLWGHGRYVLPLLAALLALAPLVLGRLPARQRPLGWLSWALGAGPLLGLVVRQQYPPPRTLLVVLLFSSVLVALLTQLGWHRVAGRWPGRPASKGRLLAVALLLVLHGAWHLAPEWRNYQRARQHQRAVAAEYAWLQARHPRRVWLDEDSRAYQGRFLHHLGRQRGAPLPLAVAAGLPATGPPATYALHSRQGGAVPPALAARPPVYVDAYCVIWQLSAPAIP